VGARYVVKLKGEPHVEPRRSLRCDEREVVLIYSMSVSVDGFIADRERAHERYGRASR
jgi:hypothetical protein